MATDKSEPRVGLIFKIGFLAVVILVGIRGALTSYFDGITSAEEQRKFGDIVPAPLLNLRAAEDLRLKSGPLPIEKAMQEMVAKGRMSASPDIMPSATRDIAPMQGWMKMPVAVPAAMMAPPPEVTAPATAPDGGAPHAMGAPMASPMASPDAGAPKKPAKK